MANVSETLGEFYINARREKGEVCIGDGPVGALRLFSIAWISMDVGKESVLDFGHSQLRIVGNIEEHSETQVRRESGRFRTVVSLSIEVGACVHHQFPRKSGEGDVPPGEMNFVVTVVFWKAEGHFEEALHPL